MSTKAILEAAIATFETGGLNTALEYRNFMNNIIKADLYPNNISENAVSNSYTDPQSENLPYSLNFRKQGGTVFVQGAIGNLTGGSVMTPTILTFPLLVGGVNNQFIPDDANDAITGEPREQLIIGVTSSGAIIQFALFWQSGTPRLRGINGTLPATSSPTSTWVRINGSYQSKY